MNSQAQLTLPLSLLISLPPNFKKAKPTFTTFVNATASHFEGLKAVKALRYDGPVMEVDEETEFVMESCVVRTLEPALTLEHGLRTIAEALEDFKLCPPNSPTGILRFQVAVPPSRKALNWFCCQPMSSTVYPLFYLSKEMEDPSYKSLHMHRVRGVFGIGAAIYFVSPSGCTKGEQRSIKRYLSDDTNSISIYGFVDIKFETEASSAKHETNSFYMFIPQMELLEYDSVSILAATLAWDGSSSYTIERAIHLCESVLCQIRGHFSDSTESHYAAAIRSTLRKLNVLEDITMQMTYFNALSLASGEFGADCRKLREAPSSSQFCFRLSAATVISRNMLDYGSEKGVALKEIPNINSVWASLIVEECTRQGLTYFCIAPGSRSSSLAIAASSHHLTTCIACIDERSLAFHAVGYARGSCKPAVVITSSGTAVSNLLPAVVEASQDFLPLLLLTADRPPELLNTGANQAINQVNHFGSYVRFFFNLPTPTDHIPARMVLTTLDSAINLSMSSPFGPVHINCPFREPLNNTHISWTSNFLNGLDNWISTLEPFTNYVKMQHGRNDIYGQLASVLDIIKNADKGLLIVGATHSEEEMWAVLLLAKHLSWPVVADILSGVRLRKLSTSFPEIQQRLLYIDYLDHVLLSEFVRKWMQIDVIIQLGSRITSKRISQALEECFPCAYIMVDKHPFRHDPSHIVTHRIETNIVHFADILLGAQFSLKDEKWSGSLQLLNTTIAREIAFQICAEPSLTEPHIAHVITDILSSKCALFMGNSMSIRDADTYGRGWTSSSPNYSDMALNIRGSFQQIRVAANRGASGIDGLLSTAIGFAVGCNKHVFCVIGDVSFLHDTNGLAILNQRTLRKPITIIVVNNHGGSIFSILPIADRTERKVLDQYFYTSHNISIRNLCEAHGVKHVQVQTKLELQDTLFAAQHEEMDCVIEVESSIDANAIFHSTLRRSSCQVADYTLRLLSQLMVSTSTTLDFFMFKIRKMKYAQYRIPLRAPLTSRNIDYGGSELYREGFILSLFLEDGSVGFGEVAPLNTQKENLLNLKEQLRFLQQAIKGAKIRYCLPLLNGSFASWIWNELGIPETSILPSVRCGLEMSILNAIASGQGSNLLSILHPGAEAGMSGIESAVRICALLDSNGTPKEVADIAAALVEQGFSAIKVKVARRRNPVEDAAVIQEVRKKVGRKIELRVDANRRWAYEEAIQFSLLVKYCDLQYIEEPVEDKDDILKFCEESGLPVALDETIDNIREDFLQELVKYTHPGIAAVILKPSVLGGFENSAVVAKWAQQHGKMVVVSAAFESSIGLSAYVLFSSYLELRNKDISGLIGGKLAAPVAHGLGTYQWLKDDVTTDSLKICRNPESGNIGALTADASRLLQNFQINKNITSRSFSEEHYRNYKLTVNSDGLTCLFNVQELGEIFQENTIIFLHGFLGTKEEWNPIMKSMSGSARCISVDLPGHGKTKIRTTESKNVKQDSVFSLEMVANFIYKLIHHITPGRVTLAGYSMGARIALFMALRFSDKIDGAVLISGSPGLKDAMARKVRSARDDARASFLVAHGLELFLDNWYNTRDLWRSLLEHPHFNRIASSRMQHDDLACLAKALSDLSIGRQPPLWEELKQCSAPLLLIIGEKDGKFKSIAKEMWSELCGDPKCKDNNKNIIHELVEIPNAGHAAHLENPLSVISALRHYLNKLNKGSVPKSNITDAKSI